MIRGRVVEQPKSKSLMIERLQAERHRLEQGMDGLSREEMVQPGVVGE